MYKSNVKKLKVLSQERYFYQHCEVKTVYISFFFFTQIKIVFDKSSFGVVKHSPSSKKTSHEQFFWIFSHDLSKWLSSKEDLFRYFVVYIKVMPFHSCEMESPYPTKLNPILLLGRVGVFR